MSRLLNFTFAALATLVLLFAVRASAVALMLTVVLFNALITLPSGEALSPVEIA